MRKYVLHIVCIICAVGLIGCIASDREFDGKRDGEVTLTLSLGDHTRYSTPDNGVGEGSNDDDTALISLNENLITSLEIFLYANGAEGSDATFATRLDGLNGRDKFESVTFSIPAAALNTLFANGANSCGIYVIANYNTGRTVATNGLYENTSIAELKAMEIEAEFDAMQSLDLSSVNTKYGAINNIKPQASFVMDSELSTVTKSGNNLSGSVYITRAASKITFRTTIAQSLEIDGKTWVPLLEHLSFSYRNIVNKGYIDNGSDVDTNNTFPMPEGQSIYADAVGIQMSPIFSDYGATSPTYDGSQDVEGVSGWSTIDHVVPLYTYSSRWVDGAKNEAYIMLSVPWKIQGDTSETLTYYNYFVPINMNDLKLVRNKHYRINLRVGVLGDLEELTESEYSYEVLDWVGENVEVKLQKPTYLVVDANYVEMKNLETFSVGYQSSDEVAYEVRSTTISAFKKDKDGIIISGCVHTKYTVSAENGNVTFEHELDNTRSDNDTDYDFLVQTTVVRIYHKNNPSIYEDITFVQYPAMYVTVNAGYEGNKRWNYINVNGNSWENWITSGSAGNGCPTYNGKKVYWVGVGGKSSANHNMYQITVTAFDSTTPNYLIADPRAAAQNITLFKGYTHKYNNTTDTSPDYPVQPDQFNVKEIKGYRGTLVENAENLVAPEFIIASHCSSCANADNYMYAEDSGYYRCASYQEAGYPAGRWRLPTVAELEVIGKLCAQDKLPQIFVDGVAYLSASGSFNNQGGSFTPTTKQAQSVRCVYDTWYWRDKCNDESMKKLLWAAEGNVEDMKANGTYDDVLTVIK